MKVSNLSQWFYQILYCLASFHYLIPAAATDSAKVSTARARQDNHLQYITTEPEVEICEGENVSFFFNLTIPANLTPDRLYERTVWSPNRKNYCFIYGNISKCHGEDFVQRAEISNTWSAALPGELTRHGALMFQLNNVSLGDAGYYEGELKTAYNINNVNVMLTVKEESACPAKQEGGDTATGQAKSDDNGVWWKGFGAGFGTCLGLLASVLIGWLTAKIIKGQYWKKDKKPPRVP